MSADTERFGKVSGNSPLRCAAPFTLMGSKVSNLAQSAKHLRRNGLVKSPARAGELSCHKSRVSPFVQVYFR
jgi:hypothetical protein